MQAGEHNKDNHPHNIMILASQNALSLREPEIGKHHRHVTQEDTESHRLRAIIHFQDRLGEPAEDPGGSNTELILVVVRQVLMNDRHNVVIQVLIGLANRPCTSH